MQMVNLNLLQPHTVNLYNLGQKDYEVLDVPARSLLTGLRFDLFAKLYYIRNRKGNNAIAREVYKQHIKVFNPELKEPGREDKNGYDDFIDTFDALIDDLGMNGFNPEKSLVPVDEDGVILDGAHRLCALASADRQVRIVRFDGVKSKGRFDFEYFLKRGLSRTIADVIAHEMVLWLPNMYIACLWPCMGSAEVKKQTLNVVNRRYPLCYTKNIHTNMSSLVDFIVKVYGTQPWIGNEANGYIGARDKALHCFASNRQIAFALFQADSLDDITVLKDKIRRHFQKGKHSIHITDNADESKEIVKIIFDSDELGKWNKLRYGFMVRMYETINEKLFYLKNVTLINWKTTIVQMLNL